MNRKIKVAAVSYLNAKPLLYGIEEESISRQIELSINYPSRVARQLLSDEIDVGLVPVAVIPQIKGAHIISDYVIAADGNVASVCIFSCCPIEEATELFLDYQSRTSVQLTKILLKHYFKKEIKLTDASEDYIQQIKGGTAGLIIGDRALEQLPNFPYIYDLAGLWKELTGLPFVFAAWVANKPLPEGFIQMFNQANETGLNHLDKIAAQYPYPAYDLQKYFKENIQYRFTDNAKRGLDLFLEYAEQLD